MEVSVLLGRLEDVGVGRSTPESVSCVFWSLRMRGGLGLAGSADDEFISSSASPSDSDILGEECLEDLKQTCAWRVYPIPHNAQHKPNK